MENPMQSDLASTGGTERFYETLAPFSEFGEIVQLAAYAPVPDDWWVLISDVQGSTKAIEAGRYKDVNMVGAASITAVLNTCGDVDVPFVFGGDGGTVLVPASCRKAACDALLALQARSTAMFGLALRVGAVPVADLRARGTDVRVRKFELSRGNYLAMFAGGGVELCDALLKEAAPDSPYLLRPRPDIGEPDLEGLSCRWEPLAPRYGCMLTMMVQERAPGGEGGTLTDVIGKIAELIGHRLRDSAPASPQSMRFRWPPRGLALEARATAGGRSFARRYLEVLLSSLIQAWCERFDRQAGPYNAPVYRGELRANTDFRKYDGILRIVLDVSAEQADRISNYLEEQYRAGHLVYGVHRADSALMTCLVFSLAQSEHVHFIDGSDGGYALAAKDFKRRLAAA